MGEGMNMRLVIDAATDGAVAGLKKVTSGVDQLSGTTEKSSSHWGAFRKSVGLAGVALGGALLTGLVGAGKAAVEGQISQAALDQALRRTHQSVKAMTPALEEAQQAGLKLGFSDDSTRESLAKLEIATGSTSKSIKLLATAQDIARLKHTSLEAATKMLTGAMTGQQRAARALGISVSPVTKNYDALKAKYKELGQAIPPVEAAQAKLLDKQATGQAVIAAVTAKVHGQAQAYSQTAAGGMARFNVTMQDLQEKMGTALLPAITAVAGALAGLATYFSAHTGQARLLIGALGALAAVMITVGAATRIYATAQTIVRATTAAWTAVQWALNAALTANPIGVVVIALAALAGGLVIAYQRSATFRAIVQAAFDAVKTAAHTLVAAFQAVISWLSGNWRTIATIIAGPFAPLVALATNAFGIRSALIGAFAQMVGAVRAGVASIVAAVRGAVGAATGAARAVGAGIVNGVKAGVAAIRSIYGVMWAGISGAIGAAAGAAYSAATRIGSQIISGVLSSLGGLASSIKNKVQSALSSALSNLNIPGFSPVDHAAAEAIAYPLIDGTLRGLEQMGARVGLKLSQAVRDAITQAKQTAGDAAQGLSGMIGQALDATASRDTKALDNSPEAQQLRTIEARQKAQQKADEMARLQQALTDAQTADERKAAQKAIDDWNLEQTRQTLADDLAQKKQAISDESEARKTAAAQNLNDLNDKLQRGLISQKDYNTQLIGILASTGVDYSNLGALLGSAFANGFADQLASLRGAIAAATGLDVPVPAGKPLAKGFKGFATNVPPRSKWGVLGKPDLPKHAMGIDYVPHTGPAIIHAGEAVLNRRKAAEWRAGRGGGGVSVVFADGMGWLRQFMRVEMDTVSERSRIRALAGGVR